MSQDASKESTSSGTTTVAPSNPTSNNVPKIMYYRQEYNPETKRQEKIPVYEESYEQFNQYKKPSMQLGGGIIPGSNPLRDSGYDQDINTHRNQYNTNPSQYPVSFEEMQNAKNDIRYPTGAVSPKNTSGFNFPTDDYNQIVNPSKAFELPEQSLSELIDFDYGNLNRGINNIPLGSETMGDVNVEQPLNWNVPILNDPTAPGDIDYGDPTGPFVNTDNIENYDQRYTGEEFAKPGDNNPGRSQESDKPYVPWGDITRTGMDIASFIGNRDERRNEQARVDERMSNVHRFNPTNKNVNRGDYLINTKKTGEYFRPNEHTRFGYGNNAQNGMEVNSEQELTESEIADLLAQGYQLEYLD